MGTLLQHISRQLPPPLGDLRAMGQIPQITQHARILHGRLLTRLVALIAGVRADKGENALKQRRGQTCNAVDGGGRRRVKGRVEPKGGIVRAVDALGFLLFPEPLHPVSCFFLLAREVGVWQETRPRDLGIAGLANNRVLTCSFASLR
jgi:hypothetical protein